ncbi:hypothetical protein Q8W71_17970 [Methylobacterium sp. NEAU 140]|uniref:hypothetical protein n=1 Tax=Methylobacterium sp. NEAU 140 TaxID=3064945 RepID=UPI0027356151|nr:hypothetical protein [Methylobacterium sp. NEAU 140]MDP4024514.1 hypothetical protein [Methylobacterium sp. NEAU 140]
MSADQSREGLFRAELASIVGRARYSAGFDARQDLFEALSNLERRALIGGASDRILRDIAETRFLTGILRDAVRATRTGGLRGLLRARDAVRPPPRCATRRRIEAFGPRA